MAIANFTPLPTLPTPPNTQTDTKPIFLQKADAFNPALKGWADNFNSGTVPTLNDLIALLNQQLPYINTVADSDKAIRAIYADLSSIISVSEGIDSVQTVAEQISGVKDIADNLTEVLAAKGYAEDAKKWALIAESVANIGPATPEKIGLVKPDAVTTHITEDGTITAKDVAIGGDLGDLASARGQVGPARELGSNVDYNTVTEAGFYLINATGGVNGPIVGSAAFLQVFYSKKDAFTKNLYQIVYAYSSARERMFLRQYRIASNDWSSWSEIVSSSCIGDGLTVNNGIISVPEYEGATASAAGTSGLVPPAAAGQQESFLTGGGEYKPALSTSGGTVTGNLSIKNLLDLIGTAPATEQELGLYHIDKNGNIMGGHDFVHNVNNIKAAQMYARNSSGLISSLGVYVEEDGTRYTLSSHNIVLTSDVEIGRLYADGVRLITFSGTKGSPGLPLRYSPDSGELYLDGRAVHGKADSAGYADTAGSANALGGKAESALSVAYARDSGAMNGKAESALSVNYANSAGSALIAAPAVQWVVNLSGPQITVPPGGTYNVVCICFNDSGGKGAVKHYPDTAGGTVIPNAPTDYMVAGLCARVQKEG